MSIVEKLESCQAFILPQREVDNKCSEVDMMAELSSSLPGGPVVGPNQALHVVIW